MNGTYCNGRAREVVAVTSLHSDWCQCKRRNEEAKATKRMENLGTDTQDDDGLFDYHECYQTWSLLYISFDSTIVIVCAMSLGRLDLLSRRQSSTIDSTNQFREAVTRQNSPRRKSIFESLGIQSHVEKSWLKESCQVETRVLADGSARHTQRDGV
jgi:hypothetical protein